jgi:hypothetical protein
METGRSGAYTLSGLAIGRYDLWIHEVGFLLDGYNQDLDPTWTGPSIGKWEGDTLIIDTVGFNDKTVLPNMMPYRQNSYRGTILPSRPRAFECSHHVRRFRHVQKALEYAHGLGTHTGQEVPETICNQNNHFRELAGGK